MSDVRTYFGDEGERITLERSKSHGYKKIVFDESLGIASILKPSTDGDTLIFSDGGRAAEGDTQQYTFICKEFGLYGVNVPVKVSIMFCDDGWMVVTLLDGTFLIEYEGQILQPSVNTDDFPTVHTDRILWVNADSILSMKQHFGTEIHERCYQDFEFIFRMTGGMEGTLSRFGWSGFREEYVDLSLGYTAELERMREAKQLEKSVMTTIRGASIEQELDYEEADYDDDEYDEDDDGGVFL